jgi:hypothetical protein
MTTPTNPHLPGGQEPGYAPINPAGPVAPPQAPAPRRRWLPWAIVGGVALVLAIVAGILVAGGTFSDPPLVKARQACDPEKLGSRIDDGDRTLILDTKGEQDASGGAPLGLVACVMKELGSTAAVRSHVVETRALDGRQTDSWDGFTASWSYHPNTGISMVIEQD